jgi:hypothetical protein
LHCLSLPALALTNSLRNLESHTERGSNMPKGKPLSQTVATDKYRASQGIIKKSFNIKREVADEFKEACDRAGISQGKALNDFVEQFIKEHSKV